MKPHKPMTDERLDEIRNLRDSIFANYDSEDYNSEAADVLQELLEHVDNLRAENERLRSAPAQEAINTAICILSDDNFLNVGGATPGLLAACRRAVPILDRLVTDDEQANDWRTPWLTS